VAAKLIASPDAELKAELERTPIGHLGAGSRRVLAAYLLAARRPSVLALDEPTAGLDRRNARLIGSLVREAASRGKRGPRLFARRVFRRVGIGQGLQGGGREAR
jgi:ABC-type transport system involved in cytochrome c biogenesis ATPase subunit